jgi:2-dehydropantoate 2-reductase
MKIAVIGPGALGTLLATSLAGVGNEVWLLDHNPDRAAQINKKLKLNIEEQEHLLNIPVTSQPDRIGIAELVFLCVKSMSVKQALHQATPLFTQDTLLIPFQNGIAHIEAISNSSIAINTAFGVTSQGATLLAPGHVLHGGAGVTKIGFIDSPDDQQKKQLEATAHLLSASGFTTTTVPNILDHIWTKLLVNIGINALTVIHDCPNGKLLEIPEARDTLIAAVREGEHVARVLGIHIENDPVDLTLGVCRTTASNISSMLQDTRKQKPTEIDAINGALVEKATQLSIDVPVNQLLVKKVKQHQSLYHS